MAARIYQPARSAMQSGAAKTKLWLLEYDPEKPRQIEPLMGWTSSADMRSQIHLRFNTAEEAVAYAQKHSIAYRLEQPKQPTRTGLSYSDNFKFSRNGQWTH